VALLQIRGVTVVTDCPWSPPDPLASRLRGRRGDRGEHPACVSGLRGATLSSFRISSRSWRSGCRI